jgi:hypothetical protein
MFRASIVLACLFGTAVLAGSPPKEPPAQHLDGYTLNGSIALASFYVDDTNKGKETHFVYTEKSIASYLKGARKVYDKVTHYRERLLSNPAFVVPKNDWIFYALDSLSSNVVNSSVVVFGSTEPYIETAVLELGAKHVTTVEYNNLTYMHPEISTLSKYDFPALYSCSGQYQNAFDVALSISSFDHDGLGRYGDPIDPQGDLKAMSRAMGLLKPGGIMVLTVPVGPDLVVWNLLRRYGTLRLPMLLQGWEVVERYFWEESKLTSDEPNFRKSYEPVLVLRKPYSGTTWLCDPPMVVEAGSTSTDTGDSGACLSTQGEL